MSESQPALLVAEKISSNQVVDRTQQFSDRHVRYL